MTQTPNNGYAPGVTITPMVDQGMSLRDYFAGQALAGLIAAPVETHQDLIEVCGTGSISQRSYQLADAMLAARKGGAE